METEELHRKAYNAAFDAFGLTIKGEKLVWTTEYYVRMRRGTSGKRNRRQQPIAVQQATLHMAIPVVQNATHLILISLGLIQHAVVIFTPGNLLS